MEDNGFKRMANLVGAVKNDGWMNTLTGLGGAKDKSIGGVIKYVPLEQCDLEELYAQDDIAERIVDFVPKEAVREWIEIKVEDSADQDVAGRVADRLERLEVREKFSFAWSMARLYGGSGVFISVDDSLELDEPLDFDKIRKINNLVVLNKYELSVQSIDTDIESKNFRKPLFYQLSVEGNFHNIHHSRIITFQGSYIPENIRQKDMYWGDSVLTKVFTQLRNYNIANDSMANVIQDFRVGLLKIKNLGDIICSGDSDVLKKRIEVMNLSKSVLNTILVDADSEDFTSMQTNIGGVEKIIELLQGRLIASSKLPHTVVLGEGATGALSGAGVSEDKQIKDLVSAEQELNLSAPINKILKFVQRERQGPTNGVPVEGLTWKYKELFQMNENEKTDIRLKMSQVDRNYFDMGVLDADEISNSRFGGDEYSIETVLDKEARDIQLDTLKHE